MTPEQIIAVIGACLGPVTAMFTLYMRTAAAANRRRDKADERLERIEKKVDNLTRKYDRIRCKMNGSGHFDDDEEEAVQ